MSKRNRRDVKARRRKERADRAADGALYDPDGLVRVQALPELMGMAERGETLECGCDAHELLHGMLSGDEGEDLDACEVRGCDEVWAAEVHHPHAETMLMCEAHAKEAAKMPSVNIVWD